MSLTRYTDKVAPTEFPPEGKTYFGVDENGIPYTLDSSGVKTFFQPTPSGNIFGGWMNYEDTLTSGTPINVPGTGNPVVLTCNGLGVNTNKEKTPPGVTELFNTLSNQFDFSETTINDTLGIRLDIDITTSSPNQQIKVDLVFGIGVSEFVLNYIDVVEKSSGSHKITIFNRFFVGSELVQLNPSEFRVSSDGTATVEVFGWFIEQHKFA